MNEQQTEPTKPSDDEKRAGKVKVKCSQADLHEHGEECARKTTERNALEEKKSTHVKEWNEKIRQLDAEIADHAAAVDTGFHYVDANLSLPGVDVKANGAAAKSKAKPASKAKPKSKPAAKKDKR